MSAPAAIAGTFSDYRLVKSRGVLQLVVEIPVEQQSQAFDALGYPMPGQEIHVALARLAVPPVGPSTPTEETTNPQPAGGTSAKARYAAMSLGKQAVTRAALLPKDERFRAWVGVRDYPLTLGDIVTVDEAADYIRGQCCNGGSRGLIADDPECYDKFLALETTFKIDVGEMAEPR